MRLMMGTSGFGQIQDYQHFVVVVVVVVVVLVLVLVLA